MLIALYFKFFNNLFKSWQCNTTDYSGTKKYTPTNTWQSIFVVHFNCWPFYMRHS